MSVADKLLQIDQVKQDIKQAIENKGIPMTNVAFTEYANKIADISGGGGGSQDDVLEGAMNVFSLSDNSINDLKAAWEDYKRTTELKYDLNLTFELLFEGFFDVYSGDSVLTQLYNDCVNEVIQVNELYPIDNQIFPKVALMYQGESSSLLGWPTPLYAWATSAEDSPSAIFLSDLTPFDMGVGISLLTITLGDLKFTNIKIFRQYENYEQGLIADLSEVTAFPGIENADFPLCIVDNVEEIVAGAFRDWTSNNHPLVIPSSVTSIGQYAFSSWSANSHPLAIPSGVTHIGSFAFYGWSSVPYVEIQAITPPTLASSDAFSNQNNAPIYVPDESVNDYKTATNWIDLSNRIFSINDK